MQWLQEHVRTRKSPDYARRVLDRYRLGMKAHGAIRGVRIVAGSDSCPVGRAFGEVVYHPDDAPIIPIASCTNTDGCHCTYQPVMAYETQG